MNRFSFRAAPALAAGLLLVGGCNAREELLSPEQPGVIAPGDVQSAAAAEGFYVGAVGNFGRALSGGGSNQETLWQFSGLLTDEFRSSDTFSQRNDADQRVTQTNDAVLSSLYSTIQQARGSSRTAINFLRQYEPNTSNLHQAEMYFTIAFSEMQLAEDFCNGIALGETVDGVAQYTPPLSTQDVFKAALARVDSGLTLVGSGTDAATSQVRNALLITKGRLQVDLGQFSAAATTVTSVPVAFQYATQYSLTTTDNAWWILTTSTKRYSVGDSVDALGVTTKNAIPFVSAKD